MLNLLFGILFGLIFAARTCAPTRSVMVERVKGCPSTRTQSRSPTAGPRRKQGTPSRWWSRPIAAVRAGSRNLPFRQCSLDHRLDVPECVTVTWPFAKRSLAEDKDPPGCEGDAAGLSSFSQRERGLVNERARERERERERDRERERGGVGLRAGGLDPKPLASKQASKKERER